MSEGSPAGLRVAVDVMGGDHAPEALVAGAVAAVRAGVPVMLVGDTAQIAPLLPEDVQIPITHAPEVVAMDEGAARSVRRKPESSIRVAMRLLAEGKASAVVSCGNTGASLVAAVLDLGIMRGVERPAIATVLPRSDGGRFVLLDVGATVDCKPEQLVSFAVLGAAWAEVLGMKNPRVGVLSNGEEGTKGNDLVRAALPGIEALPLHCVGQVEPTAVFAGACEVAVCDGFVGNITLKAVEGAAETVLHLLGEEIRSAPTARVGAWLAKGAIERFKQRVSWDAQGGAMFLGMKGVVVVGHGRSNAASVEAAVHQAHAAARDGLVAELEARLGAQSEE